MVKGWWWAICGHLQARSSQKPYSTLSGKMHRPFLQGAGQSNPTLSKFMDCKTRRKFQVVRSVPSAKTREKHSSSEFRRDGPFTFAMFLITGIGISIWIWFVYRGNLTLSARLPSQYAPLPPHIGQLPYIQMPTSTNSAFLPADSWHFVSLLLLRYQK